MLNALVVQHLRRIGANELPLSEVEWGAPSRLEKLNSRAIKK